MEGDKVKKSIFKRWWFWVLAIVFVIAIVGPKDKADKPDAPIPTQAEETTVEVSATEENQQAEEPISFILMDSEPGEYGVDVVLNAGTEFEEHEIAYYIPTGAYSIMNQNAKGAGQVSVYSGMPEYDGEWEYFVADENCAAPIVVMPGDTQEIEIKDGQFIVLSDGTSNFQFTLKQ